MLRPAYKSLLQAHHELTLLFLYSGFFVDSFGLFVIVVVVVLFTGGKTRRQKIFQKKSDSCCGCFLDAGLANLFYRGARQTPKA